MWWWWAPLNIPFPFPTTVVGVTVGVVVFPLPTTLDIITYCGSNRQAFYPNDRRKRQDMVAGIVALCLLWRILGFWDGMGEGGGQFWFFHAFCLRAYTHPSLLSSKNRTRRQQKAGSYYRCLPELVFVVSGAPRDMAAALVSGKDLHARTAIVLYIPTCAYCHILGGRRQIMHCCTCTSACARAYCRRRAPYLPPRAAAPYVYTTYNARYTCCCAHAACRAPVTYALRTAARIAVRAFVFVVCSVWRGAWRHARGVRRLHALACVVYGGAYGGCCARAARKRALRGTSFSLVHSFNIFRHSFMRQAGVVVIPGTQGRKCLAFPPHPHLDTVPACFATPLLPKTSSTFLSTSPSTSHLKNSLHL